MSAEPIIYGLIFIGVLVLVEGVYLVAFGRSISLNNRVNRRLEMLDKGEGREEVLERLRKEMNQHMKVKTIPVYSILATSKSRRLVAASDAARLTLVVVLPTPPFWLAIARTRDMAAIMGLVADGLPGGWPCESPAREDEAASKPPAGARHTPVCGGAIIAQVHSFPAPSRARARG